MYDCFLEVHLHTFAFHQYKINAASEKERKKERSLQLTRLGHLVSSIKTPDHLALFIWAALASQR